MILLVIMMTVMMLMMLMIIRLRMQEWFLENKITWVTMLAILAAVQVGLSRSYSRVRKSRLVLVVRLRYF